MPAKDGLSPRILNLTRFAEADRPAIEALIKKCAKTCAKQRGAQRRRGPRTLNPGTVTSYVDALHSVASKCLPGNLAASGLVAAISDDRVGLRTRMRRAFRHPPTYGTNISAIVALFNHAGGAVKADDDVQTFWRTESSDVNADATERAMHNVKSKALRDKWFSLEDLDGAIERAREHAAAGCDPDHPRTTTATLKMRLLWLVIARFTPPHRRDYGAMRVVKSLGDVDECENAVVVDRSGATMVLQAYKTDKTYGRFEHKMPDEVNDAVRESLKSLPRRYLFITRAGSPMEKGFFGNTFVKETFRRYLGKDATMNTLRRVWVAHLKDGNYTLAERAAFAKIMNHSLVTQIMRYETVDRDE